MHKHIGTAAHGHTCTEAHTQTAVSTQSYMGRHTKAHVHRNHTHTNAHMHIFKAHTAAHVHKRIYRCTCVQTYSMHIHTDRHRNHH
jgi:hypothetical protein